MVKNIFSIGYHHNMFIIEIIVNTDIAASYGLCQKRPLNNGLSIAIKRYVDILVMIYFFPISIVYKDIYQHVVFPTIRSKHIIISQKKRSIIGQCRGSGFHCTSLDKSIGHFCSHIISDTDILLVYDFNMQIVHSTPFLSKLL